LSDFEKMLQCSLLAPLLSSKLPQSEQLFIYSWKLRRLRERKTQFRDSSLAAQGLSCNNHLHFSWVLIKCDENERNWITSMSIRYILWLYDSLFKYAKSLDNTFWLVYRLQDDWTVLHMVMVTERKVFGEFGAEGTEQKS